jgi:amino acid permease
LAFHEVGEALRLRKTFAAMGGGAKELSNSGAVINIMKACIGMGILSLPYATSRVGWLPSVFGMIVVAGLTMAGIMMAIIAQKRVNKIEDDAEDISLAERAPLTASGGWAAANAQDAEEAGKEVEDLRQGMVCTFDRVVGDVLGTPAQTLCALSLVLGQLTTGIAYIKVIANSLGTYWEESFLSTYLPIFFVLSALCMVETLKRLTWLSMVALSVYGLIFAALISTAVHGASDGTLAASAYAFAPRAQINYGAWFGVSAFAFGGLPIAVLVYDDMREPRSFFKVNLTAFSLTWLIYASFAVLGYICFGGDVRHVVYFNFERGSTWRIASMWCMIVILAFTFVLQLMPVFAFCQGLLCCRDLHWAAVRVQVVAFAIIVAWLMPSILSIIGTFGAVTSVLAGMIFPAMTFLMVSHSGEFAMRGVAVLVLAAGVLGTWRAVIA